MDKDFILFSEKTKCLMIPCTSLLSMVHLNDLFSRLSFDAECLLFVLTLKYACSSRMINFPQKENRISLVPFHEKRATIGLQIFPVGRLQ